MNILVLSGGLSAEREVSLRSAQSVKSALLQNGCSVSEYDPANGLDGLAQSVAQVDVVFPVLHGKHGEDGEIQQALEQLRVPFVGSSSAVSSLCFNKQQFNRAIFERGFLVPLSQQVNLDQFRQSPLTAKPFVLKPNDGGSSIDTLIANGTEEEAFKAEPLFNNHAQMLLQERILGTEITVAVLGSKALPVIEIIPPSGEDFDYENKYNGKTQELCPPISVSAELQSLARQIAADIHYQLGVRHISRTDMIIDQSGQIYVLELNTIPGLTETSLFPKAAAAASISMSQLVEQLIQMAASQQP